MENLTKNQKIILGVLAGIALLIIGYYVIQQQNNYEYFATEELEETENSVKTEEQKEKIIVHVAGCVQNEGIVELEEGARIKDAIDAAGGETADADLSKINLAYKIKDGQKIYIPSNIEENLEEEYVITNSGNNISSDGGEELVNINTAKQTELETLPGIGPSTALKIIEHREENGEFNSIEDIKNVKGIGDSKYDNIKDFICVE